MMSTDLPSAAVRAVAAFPPQGRRVDLPGWHVVRAGVGATATIVPGLELRHYVHLYRKAADREPRRSRGSARRTGRQHSPDREPLAERRRPCPPTCRVRSRARRRDRRHHDFCPLGVDCGAGAGSASVTGVHPRALCRSSCTWRLVYTPAPHGKRAPPRADGDDRVSSRACVWAATVALLLSYARRLS